MKVLKLIYSAYAILLFVLLKLLLGLFILIPVLVSKKGDRISFFFIRLWAGIWSFLCGIRYEVIGKEVINQNQPYIYIFNHRSFLDAPVIPMAIPQVIRALGKKELSKIPVFGWIVGKFAIWVDRTNAESRRKSIDGLVKYLNQGISVVVAPEGTRNNSGETLLPFHKGAFRLAVETQIPVIPMAVIGADKIMRKGSLLLSPGKIRIYFSQPIYPPPPSDSAVDDLAEKCRNILEAMILTQE